MSAQGKMISTARRSKPGPRTFFFLLTAIAAASPARAAKAGFTAAVAVDFPGYEIYDDAAGDLNGDGKPDAAAILFKAGAEQVQGTALIVVYMSKGAVLKLHTKAEKATCVGCGGAKSAWDAPLGKLSVDRGVLKVAYEGGSREMFDDAVKWRYERARDKFAMIGETQKTTDTIGEEADDVIDVNFSNMKMTRRVGNRKKTCAVPPEQKGVDLDAFDYEGAHQAALQELTGACEP